MRAFTISLILLLTMPAAAQEQPECNGPYNGEQIHDGEKTLEKVLEKQKQWFREASYNKVNFDDPDPRRANLCGAELTMVTLSGANLYGANLSGAILEGANLSEANLMLANLSAAILGYTNLSGANLYGANLSGAILEGANLSGAFYEPEAGKQPLVDSIALATGLHDLRYELPRALVNLRKQFMDAGYREQERQITYAIKHGEVRERFTKDDGEPWLAYGIDLLDGGFNYVLFDVTTAWGMSPGRALWIVVVFIALFTPAYWKALVKPTADGIWIVWSKDRRRQDLGAGDDEQTSGSAARSPLQSRTDKPLQLSGKKAWRVAFYFSVLSAFHIGWRDLNVGNWIDRIQHYEFTYTATGWVRTVSGIQSLLSVYLLATWALTYFGRPFQ